MNITLVTKAQITAAINTASSTNVIAGTSVSHSVITASSGFNGMAFDSSGYVYVGNNTTLRKYDPSTWNLVSIVTTNLDDSTDLSSCAYPPTLTLQKVLPSGRTISTDQFTLTIKRGSEVVTSATTTGADSGVQADKAGPTPVVKGQQYTISENGAGSGNNATDLGLYTSSVSCVDTANGNNTISVSSGGVITVPSTATSPVIVCTYTNTPKVGALQITKAFDQSVPSGSGTNTTFSGSWTCTLGTGSNAREVASGTWTRQGTGAATLTAASSGTAANKIPVGASCGATETSPSSGSSTGLPDSSWVWGTPTISSVVTIAVGNTSTITVTNRTKREVGSATWTKSAADNAKTLLGGSTWTLTGPSVPANTVVTDCVASPCDTGSYKDQDPAAGKFSITNIPFGAYTLTEQTAPAGYVVDSTVHTFTVNSTTNVNAGNFTNQQQNPLTIPLTGGLSADWMYLSGAGIAAIALATAGGLLWRGRRQQ